MGIKRGADSGVYTYGKGSVQVIRMDPKDYALKTNNSQQLINITQERYRASGSGTIAFKNNFYLQRGPFELIAVMDESVSEENYTIRGTLIDLFDPKLPVYSTRSISPGQQAYFFNIDLVKDKQKPQVLAAASRVYNEKIAKASYSYIAKSPIETTNISRILLPRLPKSVTIDGNEVFDQRNWDEASKTYLLGFENNPDGVEVAFVW